jgi:hypothetical protein
VIGRAIGKAALRWLLYAVAFVVLLSAIDYGLSFVPFTPQHNAKRAAAQIEAIEGQVSTLEREASGNAQIAAATETYHTREVVIRQVAARAETEARIAPDANTPLPADRLDRLRAADNRLCIAHPAVCPAPDLAPGNAPAVSGNAPAG